MAKLTGKPRIGVIDPEKTADLQNLADQLSGLQSNQLAYIAGAIDMAKITLEAEQNKTPAQ